MSSTKSRGRCLGDLLSKLGMVGSYGIQVCIWLNYSDLTRFSTPNGGLVREMGPLISGKSRLVKYYSLARCMYKNACYCLHDMQLI